MSIKSWFVVPMFLLCTGVGFTGTARADDFAGIKVAKAVWNVTTGNEKVFIDRMQLIRQTAESLRKRGITPEFVLVIHGKAAKFIAKDLHGTKFAKDKLPQLAKAHAVLQNVKAAGAHVEVCAIAMKRAKIRKSNVRPVAVIQENVFENLIVLQNKGYSYMPIH